MRNITALFLTGLMLFGLTASASSTRTIDADALISSDHVTTYTVSTFLTGARQTQEVPTGTCNGSTTAFTLSASPTAATLVVSQDGLTLIQGAGKDYTISGSTITLATACALGQTLIAVYFH